MAEQHGLALLGAGLFATNSHLPALSHLSTRLVAVYSRSQASAQALVEASKAYAAFEDVAVYSGERLDKLLARDDVQTVVLALPITVQPAIIERAWKAGKNVVSEKPIAKDLAEARRLIELWEGTYKPKGIQWIIAEQFPYEPSFTKAKELIAQGKIGELRSFGLEFYAFVEKGSKYYETSWRKVPEYQGGFLLDGGVHQAAGLRHILPCDITSIVATSSLLQPHLPPFDTLHGVLSTSSPAQGTFSISFGIESATKRMYTFRGSKGTLVVDFSGRGIHVLTLFLVESGEQMVIEIAGRGVEEEFEAFAKALEGGMGSEAAAGVEERSGPRAALRDLAFIEGALRSGETGERVDLRRLEKGEL